MARIHDDGGFGSRKLLYALLTSGLVVVGAAVAAAWEPFAGQFGTMVEGLLGALGLYTGGNLAHKWVAAKNPAQGPSREDEEEWGC